MICNGANGTAADPNGQDGGTVFGNGGAGYTYNSTTDPTGALRTAEMAVTRSGTATAVPAATDSTAATAATAAPAA